jgi:hypothetical protein
MNNRTQRSPEARDWQKWYKLKAWLQRRAGQLAKQPLCEMCLKMGHVTVATVCDHVEQHRGDWDLFIRGDVQSLCRPHHSSTKQREERRGYSIGVGADGYPLDPGHAWNGGRLQQTFGYSIPHGVRLSAIPVMLVYGPPAAGKTTLVARRSSDGDIAIDLDLILVKIGGVPWDRRPEFKAKAFAYRDRMICGLADKRKGTGWLIVTAPTATERAAWKEALGNVTEVPVIPTMEACMQQMRADASRQRMLPLQDQEIRRWYAKAGDHG